LPWLRGIVKRQIFARLTFVTVSVTTHESNLALKDAVRVMPDGKGRVRCLRAGPHQPRSRAARASCLPALRPARGVLRCNRARRRRSNPRHAVFREAWPGAEPWGRESLWREPWWNADRRARPQAEGGASRPFRGATRTRWCGTSKNASVGVPLPFSFLRRVGRAKRNPPWLDRKMMGFAALYPSYISLFDKTRAQ